MADVFLHRKAFLVVSVDFRPGRSTKFTKMMGPAYSFKPKVSNHALHISRAPIDKLICMIGGGYKHF